MTLILHLHKVASRIVAIDLHDTAGPRPFPSRGLNVNLFVIKKVCPFHSRATLAAG